MGAKKHAPQVDAPYPKDRASLLRHLFSWPPTRGIKVRLPGGEVKELQPSVTNGAGLLAYWVGRRAVHVPLPGRGEESQSHVSKALQEAHVQQVIRFVRLWDIPAEVFETLTGEKVPSDG